MMGLRCGRNRLSSMNSDAFDDMKELDDIKINHKAKGLSHVFKIPDCKKSLTPETKDGLIKKLADQIRKNAVKDDLSIKKLSVGENVEKLLGRSNLKKLKNYIENGVLSISSPSLKIDNSSDVKQIVARKTVEQVEGIHYPVENDFRPSARKMSYGSGGRKGKSVFSYLPGFGGPFGGMPPLMLNPVHFHPNISVTVKRDLDYENANTAGVQHRALRMREQVDDLSDINVELASLEGHFDTVDNVIHDDIGAQVDEMDFIDRSNRDLHY